MIITASIWDIPGLIILGVFAIILILITIFIGGAILVEYIGDVFKKITGKSKEKEEVKNEVQ